MKKSIIAFILFAIAAAFLVSGCSQYGGNQEAQQAPAAPTPPAAPEAPAATAPAPPEAPPAPPIPPAAQAAAKTIEITASGFSPSPLTVKAGDTVIFLNKDTAQHWPASAMHPTHAVYPGSNRNKCATADAATIFDACKGLATGETFEFIFNEKGTWKYHDHLNPSLFGAIVVE